MARSHMLLGAAVFGAVWQHPILTPVGVLTAPQLGGPAVQQVPGGVALGISFALATLSALGPDIDKRGSTIARSGGMATRLTAWSVEHALSHRGPLHSLLAVVAVVLVGNALGAAILLTGLGSVVGFGWAAHLLGDVATRRGIPALWPLPYHVRPPLRFRTGTWQEALVLTGALAACGLWALTAATRPGGAA